MVSTTTITDPSHRNQKSWSARGRPTHPPGLRGFYAGAAPAIQRAALVNLGELTTYDSAKAALVPHLGDSLRCHLAAAICSGFVAALFATPADVCGGACHVVSEPCATLSGV